MIPYRGSRFQTLGVDPMEPNVVQASNIKRYLADRIVIAGQMHQEDFEDRFSFCRHRLETTLSKHGSLEACVSLPISSIVPYKFDAWKMIPFLLGRLIFEAFAVFIKEGHILGVF